MIHALRLAFQDLAHGRMLTLWMKSVGLALALFAVIGAAIFWGVLSVSLIPESLAGGMDEGLRAGLSALIAVALTVLAAWFLLRAIIIAMLSVFADDIVELVEERHYPFIAASGARPSFGKSLSMGLRSLGRLVLVNLLASPIYIALLITGVGTAAAFLAVNGWLFGKDLDEMVQVRHAASGRSSPLRPVPRTLLGVIGTLAVSVPLLGLFAPILAVAMAVHLSHGTKP